MSVSISAAIVVGVHRSEFKTDDEFMLLEDMLDDDELQMFCPAYDDWEGSIIGLLAYPAGKLEFDGCRVIQLMAEFHSLTGKHASLFVTPDVM